MAATDNIELLPFQKVGPFGFRESIQSYQHYDFEFFKCDDKTEWDLYSFEEEGIELYTEGDLIVSIACRKSLNYRGVSIIGLGLETFLETFNLKPSSDPDKIYMADEDAYQDVFEIDDIGVQLWCKVRVIVTVFCSPEDN